MAAAQINDPDIYVLDEPSANLDNHSAWLLAESIKQLKDMGKTSLQVIEVVCMQNGEIQVHM